MTVRLIEAWLKQPNEALRELILENDEREPRADLRGLEQLKTAEVASRFEALRGAKVKDPRVTRALEALVMNVPWSSDGAKGMWRVVFDAIARTKDPRFRALEPTFKVRPTMQDWLQKQFAAAIADLPAAFPPADEQKWKKELAALPAKKVSAGEKDEAGLLANVYANPLDDAPRLVLADFLTERGDPRGEFITLQFAQTKDLKREKALLKEHGRKWLGELAPVVGVDVEWKRGFPARGLVKFKAQRDAEKHGARPEWSTFEELEWSEPGASAAKARQWTLFISPVFKHLIHARRPHLPLMLTSREPFHRLETLTTWLPEASAVKDLVASKNFPKLHTLHLPTSPPPAWFKGVTQLGNVKTLQLSSSAEFALWLEVARSITSLEALHFGSSFRFARNASGAFTRLTVDLPTTQSHWWQFAAPIPDGVVETLDFTGGGKLPPEEEKALRAKVGSVRRTPAKAPGGLPPLDDTLELVWLDERQVAIAAEGQLFIVDVAKAPKLVATWPGERSVTVMTCLPDGTLVVGTSSSLRGVDVKTGEEKWSFEHPWVGTSLLDVSADGARISRGKIGVFDVKKREALPPPKGAKDDLRTPDDQFWIRPRPPGPYELRRPGARLGVALEGGRSFVGPIVCEGRLIAQAPQGLTRWNVETGAIEAQLKPAPKDEELPRLPPRPSTNRRFIVALVGARRAVVATLPDLKVVGHVKTSGQIDGLAVADDGRRVAVLSDQKVSVLEVA